MTQPNLNNNLLNDLVKLLCADGTESFAKVLSTLLNHAMIAERSEALGAAPYERTDNRKGHANGFKPKSLQSRVGELKLSIPQVRGDAEFYPSALMRGQRSERALTLSIAEMYIQGVSTRDVTQILEKLAGTLHISATQVSNSMAELDEQMKAWRERPLAGLAYPYLILDATYEKVRRNGVVLDCAVLVAIGVDESGHRSVLGVSAALSEAEVHWRDFLSSLIKRGLRGTTFIVSDDHAGLGAARAGIFPGVPWQRCQFHLQQNALHYVPKVSLRSTVAEELGQILRASDLQTAQALLNAMVTKYRKSAPELSDWLEKNVPESLAVFSLPLEHRAKMRTSNAAERLNQEIKRRTKVVRVFPNTPSLLRLVTAVLCDISDHWDSSRNVYLTMKPKTA